MINSRQELKRDRHSGSINLSPVKKNTIAGQETCANAGISGPSDFALKAV